MPGKRESHFRSDFLFPFVKVRSALVDPNEAAADGSAVTDHLIPFSASRSAARNRLWVIPKKTGVAGVGDAVTIDIAIWVHVQSDGVLDLWVKWAEDLAQPANAILRYDNLPGYDARILVTTSAPKTWDIYASHSGDMGHP